MTQNTLKPGDPVRLTIDIGGRYAEYPDGPTILGGTKGSIGIIVTIAEYRAFREEKAQRQYPGFWQEFIQEREDHFQGIDEAAKRGDLLLVQFETVMPPSTPLEPGDFVDCEVGDVKQIYVDFLEKIE